MTAPNIVSSGMGTEINHPPLFGDGRGNFRIQVLGNSGSGKTTTARQLAHTLNLPLISLDTLFWQPGWKPTPKDQMTAKVKQTLETFGNSWVVEGDYFKMIGTVVTDATTDIIWLDPPLLLYFPRLVLRTIQRLLGLVDPCSPGCNERLSETVLSRDSIILYCLTNHFPNRRRNLGKMSQFGLDMGTDVDHRRMRRVGGWGREYVEWMAAVEAEHRRE
ncbi:hypothetical protein FA15DRAFT_670403 [Coprinopsis marcescibilis]|uniref:P-loop containing nucleoside triphosphate hydrolase protein n=1 Tax=Coprinopsis marcescibilis TaxID=230819 RepID=A0A5C3KTR2_COPMA|nr:hypothetical protein FA15DRAFT_670403 [Coprinopsis marcescibilis]